MGGFLDYNILNKNLRKTDLAKNKTINVFIYLLQFEFNPSFTWRFKKRNCNSVGFKGAFYHNIEVYIAGYPNGKNNLQTS